MIQPWMSTAPKLRNPGLALRKRGGQGNVSWYERILKERRKHLAAAREDRYGYLVFLAPERKKDGKQGPICICKKTTAISVLMSNNIMNACILVTKRAVIWDCGQPC